MLFVIALKIKEKSNLFYYILWKTITFLKGGNETVKFKVYVTEYFIEKYKNTN